MEIPASNSPVPAAMIRIAQSAWEVPVIMSARARRGQEPGAASGREKGRTLDEITVTGGVNDGDHVLEADGSGGQLPLRTIRS